MPGQGKNIEKVYTRRDFFSYLLPVLSLPALLWWFMVAGRTSNQVRKERIIVVNQDQLSDITFRDGAILVKRKEGFRAFEAKCTHLGCTIKRADGDQLVCPCHGSRFDLNGIPIKGPAIDPLKELHISVDNVNGSLEIKLH